eukprot:TRINITY_DN12183_c0_g1_i1.p1 TRINITY_DN12183_c0_g1~~TRINITY_DN12183_c0_g1_i1.p1  ORF type:complete len:143 (-),score=35.73 TRINITY_DN12183_c0_g1_i1:1075-1503(-)
MNVKQFTVIGLVFILLVAAFIISGILVGSPFIYNYGDSTTCQYTAYDDSVFSLNSCKNLYNDFTSDGEIWFWVGRMSGLSKLNQILFVYLLPYQNRANPSKFSLTFKLWVRARKSEYGKNDLLLNGDSIDREIECVLPRGLL